jgi:hypothetical protein
LPVPDDARCTQDRLRRAVQELTSTARAGTLRLMSPRAVVSLLLLSCWPMASSPPPLEPEDFVMAGLPPDADSAEIRLSLGEPDSIVIADNPYDAFTPVESWHYADFIIRYEGNALPSSVLLTGAGETTLRGVRVGDAGEHVLRMYGAPTYRQDPVWSYVDPVDGEATQVLEFLIENDTVMRIHIARSRY